MTFTQLKKLLETTSYPVEYHHFNLPPEIPCIVYKCTNENVSGADYSNDIVAKSYRVELYTNEKDLSAEYKVEQVLGFTHFDKTEGYIDGEKLFQIAYDFEIKSKL